MGEYMSFMISRETENVGSSQEVINAFKALTEGGKRLYVTEAELYQVTIQAIALVLIAKVLCWITLNLSVLIE